MKNIVSKFLVISIILSNITNTLLAASPLDKEIKNSECRVVVDGFQTPQTSGSPTSSSIVLAPETFGGEREIVSNFSYNKPSPSNENNVSSSTGFSMNSIIISSQNTSLIYDGADNDSSTLSATEEFDLTYGGILSQFNFDFSADFNSFSSRKSYVTIKVFTKDDYSSLTKEINSNNTTNIYKFSDFTKGASSTNSADFTKITAIEVNFQNSAGLDAIFNNFTANCDDSVLPNLEIIKAGPTSTVSNGDLVEYSLNTKTSKTSGIINNQDTVLVLDVLPSELEFVSAEGVDWTCSNLLQEIKCEYKKAYKANDNSFPVIKIKARVKNVSSATDTTTIKNNSFITTKRESASTGGNELNNFSTLPTGDNKSSWTITVATTTATSTPTTTATTTTVATTTQATSTVATTTATSTPTTTENVTNTTVFVGGGFSTPISVAPVTINTASTNILPAPIVLGARTSIENKSNIINKPSGKVLGFKTKALVHTGTDNAIYTYSSLLIIILMLSGIRIKNSHKELI